jgi:hypothetical protein
MLTLPASAKDVLADVIVPALALLDPRMDSPEARLMLLAVGGQESGWMERQQIGGPAQGLWQFERNGVLGVMNASATGSYAYNVCQKLGVTWGSTSILGQLAQDDELACVFARLLLWSDPRALPEVGDMMGAFNYYERTWRPGKPSYTRWKQTAYPQALAALQA